jgi:hypothetical protein
VAKTDRFSCLLFLNFLPSFFVLSILPYILLQMTEDTSFDNTIYCSDDDDENDSSDEAELECKKCSLQFRTNDKMCSKLRELCAKCFKADKDLVNSLQDPEKLAKLSSLVESVDAYTEAIDKDNTDIGASKKSGPAVGVTSSDTSTTPKDNTDTGASKKSGPAVGVTSSDASTTPKDNTDTETANGAIIIDEENVMSTEDILIASFHTDEASLTANIGGGDGQLYVHKKFAHGPHKCLIDLEAQSKIPLMHSYYLLSALACKNKTRSALYSRCWVETKKGGKLYLLLCILRAKCLYIRYDFLLWDPMSCVVFLLCGISKMAAYRFLPDRVVDHEFAVNLLKEYICNPKNNLELRPGSVNKDEYGALMSSGYDPIEAGLDGTKSDKRKRNPPKNFAAEGSSKQKSSKKSKMDKKGTTPNNVRVT